MRNIVSPSLHNDSIYMQYDFNTPINRKNTYSCKWDFCAKYLGDGISHVPDDIISMWIADMDFMTAPPIKEALKSVVEHGIYGYSDPSPDIEQCVATWLHKEHAWTTNPCSIIYITTAISGLYFVLESLTNKGDTIVTHEPIYPPIPRVIRESERHLNIQTLKKNSSASGHKTYAMDFVSLEEALKKAKIFILCNPHNPTGTVWSYEELATIIKLCKKHDVIICSDDVHGDVVYAPYTYKPIAAVAQEVAPDFVNNIITILSPNKIFNTGGIKIAMLVISDENKRTVIDHKQRASIGYSLTDIFGIAAIHAGYSRGFSYKASLIQYLTSNRNFLMQYIREKCEGISLIQPQATYLAWLDFSDYMSKNNLSYTELKTLLLQHARVGLSPGNSFGEGGIDHMRLNFACPRSILEEALKRLSHALFPNSHYNSQGHVTDDSTSA